MKITQPLCLIHNDTHVLLGMKKRGFGMGRWNGFGGKKQPHETVEEAIKRETLEESGLVIEELEQVGILDFEFEKKPGEILEVPIFRVRKWKGEPVEGEEMKPQWWDMNEIPFKNMWPDDSYWFPLFLKNRKFEGRFLFGPNDSVLEYHLRIVG